MRTISAIRERALQALESAVGEAGLIAPVVDGRRVLFPFVGLDLHEDAVRATPPLGVVVVSGKNAEVQWRWWEPSDKSPDLEFTELFGSARFLSLPSATQIALGEELRELSDSVAAASAARKKTTAVERQRLAELMALVSNPSWEAAYRELADGYLERLGWVAETESQAGMIRPDTDRIPPALALQLGPDETRVNARLSSLGAALEALSIEAADISPLAGVASDGEVSDALLRIETELRILAEPEWLISVEGVGFRGRLRSWVAISDDAQWVALTTDGHSATIWTQSSPEAIAFELAVSLEAEAVDRVAGARLLTVDDVGLLAALAEHDADGSGEPHPSVEELRSCLAEPDPAGLGAALGWLPWREALSLDGAGVRLADVVAGHVLIPRGLAALARALGQFREFAVVTLADLGASEKRVYHGGIFIRTEHELYMLAPREGWDEGGIPRGAALDLVSLSGQEFESFLLAFIGIGG